MAFSDDFTGTTGQLLSARPGWSLLFGDDCLKLDANGRLNKAASTGAVNVYVTADDGAAYQVAQADLLAATNYALIVLGAVVDGKFVGYHLRMQTGLTAARVYRHEPDGTTQTLVLNMSSGIANGNGIQLRATVGASSTVIEVYQGSTLLGSFTDSTANRRTSGRRGVAALATSAVTAGGIDNYVDNYSPPASITIAAPAFPFREGIRGAGSVPVAGTYTGSVAAIQARLVTIDGQGVATAVSGFDWSTRVASPSGNAYSFTFANVPVGGPYRVQVRDSALPGTVIMGSVDRYVGAVVLTWGQSQCDRLSSLGLGGVTPTAGMKAFLLRMSNKTTAGNAINLINIAALPGQVGSGIIAAANQWCADTNNTPICFVDVSYPGVGISSFINDTQDNTMSGSGWTLWSGVVMSMLNASDLQASLVMFMQGTSDVGTHGVYPGKMDQLRDKFAAALPSMTPLYGVVPHHRSDDGPQTWNMRNAQYEKSISGGTWRTLAWLLDWQMDSDDSAHQTTAAAGNPRGGTRIGRGIAKWLSNTGLDNEGPRIVSAQFTSVARTAFDVTFDRDIETPGGATSNLPGHHVSTDSGANFPAIPSGYTAAIQSARVLRITSTGAAFPADTTRYDLLRYTPFSSNSAEVDFLSSEATLEANAFSKVLTDTTSFDGGRGMPARPVMGLGFAVAAAAGVVLPRTPNTLRLSIGLGL